MPLYIRLYTVQMTNIITTTFDFILVVVVVLIVIVIITIIRYPMICDDDVLI